MRRIALLFTLLAGCTQEEGTGRYEAPLCDPEGRCGAGADCREGLCLDECSADSDCTPDAACVDGVCWSAAGAACTTDSECAADELCVAGVCVLPPPPVACVTDADCPGIAYCESGSCRTRCGAEACGDGIDGDCDGLVDDGCAGSDADGDGFDTADDCDDTD